MRILRFTPTVAALVFAGRGQASSIFLKLEGSEKRCIADSVRAGAETSFSFRAAEGHSPDNVKVKVIDPLGRDAHNAKLEDKWHKHVIDKENHKGGTYEVCFQNNNREIRRVELVEGNVIPEAEPNKEMEEHLQKADKLLKDSKEVLESLTRQMKETKLGEDRDEVEDSTLRSRINTGSCFTMVVLISASAWQLILLNKYFRSKKLI